jgi:hypothetical protein
MSVTGGPGPGAPIALQKRKTGIGRLPCEGIWFDYPPPPADYQWAHHADENPDHGDASHPVLQRSSWASWNSIVSESGVASFRHGGADCPIRNLKGLLGYSLNRDGGFP